MTACRSSELSLQPASAKARAALDRDALVLRLQNRGRRTCFLKGYVLASLIRPDGQPLPVTLRTAPQTTTRREPKVVLRPMRAANFAILHPPVVKDAGCTPWSEVSVAPPGDPATLAIAASGVLCGSELVVTPFWYDSSETL